jgi:hypothetical protein
MENMFSSALILGLVFACCGTSDFSVTTDCGIDGFDCFSRAAENGCSPAKMVVADDLPMEATITGEYDSLSCNVELRILTKSEMYDLFREEGADEETISMFEATYGDHFSTYENKKATCIIGKSYMEQFFYYGDFNQQCSGELVSY